MVSARNDSHRFHGIAASPGIAVGRLRVVDRARISVAEYAVPPEHALGEILRLEQAFTRTRADLAQLKEQLRETTGEEHLFLIDTHQLILSDEQLYSEAVARVESELINAEAALARIRDSYREVFAGMDDPYLSERIGDVEVVIEHLLRNLADEPHSPIGLEGAQIIIAAHDIFPADILQLDRNRIVGLVTEIGGKASHVSILARAFELPTVVAVPGIADRELDGLPVILDGLAGCVTINPDQATFLASLEQKRRYEYTGNELLKVAALPAITPDGVPLCLKGNVEVPEEGASVLRHGGEGVGLYRTEMLFLNRRDMPDEEEQYRVYRAVQQSITPHSLTIRTLDAGGDKLLYGAMAGEDNPALGVRGIRLALGMPEQFKKQLRAILRVGATGSVSLMFPMISGVEELRQARQLLQEAQEELAADGVPHDPQLRIGIMVEVPSAVLIADVLAREVDFFSVGTNDLIQYTLASDRCNQHLSAMYQPLHPAVLRSLQRVVEAADRAGIPACICGEMAGDPLYLPLLLGLGFHELSMGPVAIPRVKQILRQCSSQQAAEITAACLGFVTAAEADNYLREIMASRFQLYT